ncbi:TatD family hydrolase [Flammeovirgaceae bacterium SG7u.111]|nr:TatD family hydrolase [Flammeovirgaceae bacterium SG7u.132]WPO37765.1 TatD family hydrolase [Flammeovirgaceae bacterium SG7u.111]
MPKNTLYIDIHTHNSQSEIPINTLQVTNLSAHEIPSILNSDQTYSMGIHPWHIEKTILADALSHMENLLKDNQIIAVGEAGLDRAIKTSFDTQQTYLIPQVKLAQKYRKPVIFHCVRAYPDLIAIKKKLKPTIPLILHGFNGNQQIYNQLEPHGFFFSFGKILLNPNSKIHSIFAQIPQNRFFLETDEAEVSISEIYQSAAKIKGVGIGEIEKMVKRNFKDCFGKILE